MGINAFLLGAHSVNPDIKLKIVWAYTWFDPPKEADAAKVLMDQGADIITQHTDSTAALQAAAERNVLAFGQASDMIQFAPSTQLTSIIDEWGPYYVERTQAVLDGTWTSGDTWHGMSDGLVVMAPYTNMPNDVATLAAETAESIRTGAFHPFTGPIHNQAGELVVPEGEVADDGMLAGMMFYVKGIDDEVPN
jgi:simple sugar transport system substrate-binding protein